LPLDPSFVTRGSSVAHCSDFGDHLWVPQLAEAAASVDDFQNMICNRETNALDAWLSKAEQGLLSSFVRGLRADRTAVAAAMEEPWSNGQAEGQINRLKTLKRQMYGRAKLDLLKARMIAA
ncbi:MAG: transposase, partial [Pseudomonadota bacterium]